jgi:uncharacterized protein YhhL (DUF1145 family)
MDYPILISLAVLAIPIGAAWPRSRQTAVRGGVAAVLAVAVLFALIVPLASAIVVALLLALGSTVLWAIPAAILSSAAQRTGATPWYAAWAVASYAGLLLGLLVLHAMGRPERRAV